MGKKPKLREGTEGGEAQGQEPLSHRMAAEGEDFAQKQSQSAQEGALLGENRAVSLQQREQIFDTGRGHC